MCVKCKKLNGCGKCELQGENCSCMDYSVPVNITFKNKEKADNWGHIVTVFNKGETVLGYAVIKDGIGYCASARSNIYDEYEDFINPDNAEIELIEWLKGEGEI